MITIAIHYDLFRAAGKEAGGPMDPVTSAADLALQDAIRSVDTARRVEQVDDRNQSDVLHHYLVNDVPWELPIEGHVIDFENFETSIWNVKHRVWMTPTWGASLVYPVRPVGAAVEEPGLFLVVATEGARARTETAHISQSV